MHFTYSYTQVVYSLFDMLRHIDFALLFIQVNIYVRTSVITSIIWYHWYAGPSQGTGVELQSCMFITYCGSTVGGVVTVDGCFQEGVCCCPFRATKGRWVRLFWSPHIASVSHGKYCVLVYGIILCYILCHGVCVCACVWTLFVVQLYKIDILIYFMCTSFNLYTHFF